MEIWEDNWFDDEEMQEILYKYAVAMDKDVADEDWVPEAVKSRKKQRQQREQKCMCCISFHIVELNQNYKQHDPRSI